MHPDKNKVFGGVITRLIAGEDLSADEAHQAFCLVLANEVSEMQQGAFLAALTAKGETAAEVAGGWKAIYQLDTAKVTINSGGPVVDNCGTGMDTFKTFNISTAASIIAAAGGVRVARHGARGITSMCGTVDMAESLGVDVECDVQLVADSIEAVGLGLFNGMSPKVHPMALGRILSQISFGSPLNIAASLANPALPGIAVRGVYAPQLLVPVAQVMQSIGYTDALVVYGRIDDSDQGMDEASVCGPTLVAELRGGAIREYEFIPEDCGLNRHAPKSLAADSSLDEAALRMVSLLSSADNPGRVDAVLLNAGLIFYINSTAPTIAEGVSTARGILNDGRAMATLGEWVSSQNRYPEKGLSTLDALKKRAGV